MMKIALSALVTILLIIALFIKPLRAHRWKIMTAYALSVIFLFAFYNYRTINLILPFYQPKNQMFYQKEYTDTKEYPDALLPYLLNGKEVAIPSQLKWDESVMETYDHWQNGGMLNMNIYNILSENGAKVDFEDYLYIIDREIFEKELSELGYLNDTFRYSFFYNDIQSEYGNGFYYYWSYGASTQPFELLVWPDGIKEASKLYLMFDYEGNKLYLISSEVYEKHILGGLYNE